MRITYWRMERWPYLHVKEYSCCVFVWQIPLSRNYPGRDRCLIRCPLCGDEG